MILIILQDAKLVKAATKFKINTAILNKKGVMSMMVMVVKFVIPHLMCCKAINVILN